MFVHRLSLFLIIFAMAVGQVGCKGKKSTNADDASKKKNTQKEFSDDLTSDQILQSVLKTYQQASSYQDKAMLRLTYRLKGQRLEEPKRWSTAYSRSDTGDQIAVEAYNAQLHSDGSILSCKIFDIETANLENQQLLIPVQSQIPIATLMRDPIARHFVAGFSELPLNEAYENSGPKLIPPPIALLTGHPSCSWIQQPIQTERLPDEALEARPCYVVRSLASGMTADIWIDQATFTLRQMSFPIKLLAPEVATSDDVKEVFLVASFQDASIDAKIESATFQPKIKPQTVAVRRFVTLPEPMPCNLIGELAPAFKLLTPEGQERGWRDFDGKTTTLIWLAGSGSESSLKPLESDIQKLKRDGQHVGIVYSDSMLDQPETNNLAPSQELQSLARRLDVPLYFDRHHNVSAILEIKSVPAAIVMDGNSRLHFAQPLQGDTWTTALLAAVERVGKGENLAAEVKKAYASYLDTYHQQLSTVSAVNLLPKSAIRQASTGNQKKRSASITIAPKKLWHCREFKQPGNLISLDATATAAFAVFDGWQSMGLVSDQGKLLERKTLGLPSAEAGTLIRKNPTSKGPAFAVFSVFGNQVHLYNADWKKTGTFPQTPSKQTIRDCGFSDLDQDGNVELLVSWSDAGVDLFIPVNQDSYSVSKLKSESLIGTGRDIVVATDGKIKSLRNEKLTAATELKFNRVVSGNRRQFAALGESIAGKWSAIGFDHSMQRLWSVEVGPQLFENALDPVAKVALGDDDMLWALADSNNVIQLVTGSGKWLGEFESPTKLSGICLDRSQQSVRLTVSNETGLECWDLQLR